MSDNILTANDIQVLMYYHAMTDDHPNIDEGWVKVSLERLASRGLIESNKDEYTTTERGAVHVKTLCETELPVQRWIKKPEQQF